MKKLVNLSIACALLCSIATATTTYNGTSILNTTGLTSGEYGVYLLSLDGTSFDSANLNVSDGADVSLSATFGSSFEVLFSTDVTFSALSGDTRLPAGYTVNYSSGIDAGDAWAILVFGSQNPSGGSSFDIFTDAGWVLPADTGGALSYGTDIVQKDSVAPGDTGTVIPEPSTALLGGLGALFLLRRRRNA